MATGQVLFQRFFYTKSFVKHSMEVRKILRYIIIKSLNCDLIFHQFCLVVNLDVISICIYRFDLPIGVILQSYIVLTLTNF